MVKEITSVHYDSAITDHLEQRIRFIHSQKHQEKIELYDEENPEGRRILGYCKIIRFHRPIEFYFVMGLEKRQNHKRDVNDSTTTGDQIVRRLNEFLIAQGTPAVLIDDAPKNFYERNNWKLMLQGRHYMMFEVNGQLSDEIKKKILETMDEYNGV